MQRNADKRAASRRSPTPTPPRPAAEAVEAAERGRAATNRNPSASIANQPLLNRESATALYMQIADLLRADIDSGVFAADGKLPAENALTRRFDVSRVTVRQAIAQLLAEGYVVSKQGKGTFVSRQKFLHDLKPMRGFYDALVAQGVEPKTKLLEFAPASASDSVRQAFGTAGADCFQLKRLYLVDDEPIALVVSTLPPQASGLTWEQANRNPIYGLLENVLKLSVTKAEVRIRARSAGASVGQLLGLSAKAALLVMERESFGSDGALRERTSFYIRPENYEFSLTVQGPLPVGSSIKNVNDASARAAE